MKKQTVRVDRKRRRGRVPEGVRNSIRSRGPQRSKKDYDRNQGKREVRLPPFQSPCGVRTLARVAKGK